MNVLIPRGSILGKHATEEAAQEVYAQIAKGTVWCLFEPHAMDPFMYVLIDAPSWRPEMRGTAKLLAYSNRTYRYAIIHGVQRYNNGTFQLRTKFDDETKSRSGIAKLVGGTAVATIDARTYAASHPSRGGVPR